MNTATSNLLRKGKINKGNIKAQNYISLFVVIGFLLFMLWMTFLYPKTFISIYLVLGLMFLPSLVLAFFCYRKILAICGYQTSIKDNFKYNVLINTAVYFLVTVPVGNIIIASFLFINYSFAQNEIQTVTLKPYDFGESNSRQTSSSYTHIKVEFDKISKRLNVGNKDVDVISNEIFKIKVSKGLFGYYIIRGYKFETGNNWH